MASNKNLNKYKAWGYFKDKPVTFDDSNKGFSWEDEYGTNHIYEDPNNGTILHHDITDKNGVTTTYSQRPLSSDNMYITSLWNQGKKSSSKNKSGSGNPITTSISEVAKTSPNETKTSSSSKPSNEKSSNNSTTHKSESTPVSQEETKVTIDESNTDTDTTDEKIISGLKGNYGDIEELRKEINELEKSKWDDSNPNARQRYQELVNQAANHPDSESYDKDKAELVNMSWNTHNKKLYVSPYDDVYDSYGSRSNLEDTLRNSEGKERRAMGILPSFLLGEYGDYRRAKNEKAEYYDIVSPDGKHLDFAADKKYAEQFIKEKNRQRERDAKLMEIEETEDGFVVKTNNGNGVSGPFETKEDAENYIKEWGEKKYTLGPKMYDKITLRDKDGKAIRDFYNEDEATEALKYLNKMNQPERLKAWAEFAYRLLNSIETNDRNLASDLAGQGRPYQSVQQKDMDARIQGNNELYYKNEQAKNENIRKLIGLADAGIINLNTLSNEQIATLEALIGKERVQQLISIAGKQEVQLMAATQMYKNWSKDQRDIYTKWLITEGSGPANETFLSYANGNLSANDLAKRYRQQLAKGGLEIQAIEEAVKKAGLENKMTQAQVDVIKELVAEQLKAAKLTNNQRIQEMATSSVDTLAKLIDAILPG